MKIPVHNPSAVPIYVHSMMILPGETRHFDEVDVPHHLRPAKPEEPAADQATNTDTELLAILDGNVTDAIEHISALTDGQIARMIELEEGEDGKQRKTLIAALNDELADRTLTAAAEQILKIEDSAVMLAEIEHAEDDVLERAAELEADGDNREAVLTAIAAEQLKRKG